MKNTYACLALHENIIWLISWNFWEYYRKSCVLFYLEIFPLFQNYLVAPVHWNCNTDFHTCVQKNNVWFHNWLSSNRYTHINTFIWFLGLLSTALLPVFDYTILGNRSITIPANGEWPNLTFHLCSSENIMFDCTKHSLITWLFSKWTELYTTWQHFSDITDLCQLHDSQHSIAQFDATEVQPCPQVEKGFNISFHKAWSDSTGIISDFFPNNYKHIWLSSSKLQSFILHFPEFIDLCQLYYSQHLITQFDATEKQIIYTLIFWIYELMPAVLLPVLD